MFMNDVNKKEEIRTIAVRHLRKYGIKFRYKTSRQHAKVVKSKKLFNVPLQHLENETVTLKNGQQLIIPKRLFEMCSFILSQVETEGIFRKEGAKSRQNIIKLSLDRGCMLGTEHHVVDVAVILKCFLRQLPEPLIPYLFHELFLRCSLIENKVEGILLACLLIPTEHLNVLCYIMQFLQEVASYSNLNKMNSYNLSVVLGPNIFPVSEKVAPKNKLLIKKTCDVIKLMIENSNHIGLIPEYIIEQIASPKGGELQTYNKVKRRRSGSLTRIFNGLKKIVGNKADEDNFSVHMVTPDLLLTPSTNLAKKFASRETVQTEKLKVKNDGVDKPKTLERRWSIITSAANLKRKKRESIIYQPNDSLNSSKADYVRVSKTEYEEIKNRVSAIEKRLSLELDNVQSTVIHNEVNIIHDIQSAYNHTLEQSEQLSPGTDQLARKLSRELKIRNSEQKMIRSPSARKIGNIRRRSKEMEKPCKIVRNHSLQKLSNELKVNSLTRSMSSPAKSNISVSTNLFGSPSNFNSQTMVSLNTPNNFQFRNSLDHSPNPFNKSFSLPSVTTASSPMVQERKSLKRSSSDTPPRQPCVKQRYCSIEGHFFKEVAGLNDSDKENGVSNKSLQTPNVVPHIKRPLNRTPKRLCITPKSYGRINTPLRVLPSINYVSDF